VQRKSVQLTLKQQRQQMADAAADDEDSSEQQHAQDGMGSNEDAAAAAGQGGGASTLKPRIGQWGSAKAFSEPAGAGAATAQLQPGAKPLFKRQPGSSNCSSRGILQQCGNMQQDLTHSPAAGAEAAAGSCSTASGVKAPAGPAAVPQLRKRLAKPPMGAFKAPRMTAPARNTSKSSADSSSRCTVVDGHVEQQLEQQQDAAGENSRPGSSCSHSDATAEQQQQREELVSLAADSAGLATCSKQQRQPGRPVAGKAGLQGRRGRASGRQAFVPPLKHS
jgi:hypothetical protein